MQKTKLGISVGLLGAAIYFMGLFGGYLVAVLLAGYILMFEENEWYGGMVGSCWNTQVWEC